MVTLEEGRGKGQAATVKHVMRSALFLHSKSAPCCPAAPCHARLAAAALAGIRLATPLAWLTSAAGLTGPRSAGVHPYATSCMLPLARQRCQVL